MSIKIIECSRLRGVAARLSAANGVKLGDVVGVDWGDVVGGVVGVDWGCIVRGWRMPRQW